MAKMTESIFCVCILTIALTFVLAEDPPKTIVSVPLGDACLPGAAPVGPGGAWQVVETGVDKKCPAGSTCRNGACNCNDLADGTVLSISVDDKGDRVCRRVAGQKCSADTDCFKNVKCMDGKCVCAKSDETCVDSKNDAIILN